MLLKNIFFKIKKNIKGNIDIINTNCISGWIYEEGKLYEEVRFLIGDQLISSAKINLLREDVNKFLKINSKSNLGFSIKINNVKVNKNQKFLDPRLIVFKNDGSYSKDILKLKKFEIYKKRIDFYIKDDILGFNGHIDGICDNKSIVGWAFRNGDSHPIEIWMHCEPENPIKILCISEISHDESIKKIGFSFPLTDIPQSWLNKKIKFTFDKKGNYNIPGNNDLIINQIFLDSKNNENISLDKITENNDFKILKDLSSNEFRSSWTKLENSKNYIDMISSKLEQIEKRKAKKRFIFF